MDFALTVRVPLFTTEEFVHVLQVLLKEMVFVLLVAKMDKFLTIMAFAIGVLSMKLLLMEGANVKKDLKRLAGDVKPNANLIKLLSVVFVLHVLLELFMTSIYKHACVLKAIIKIIMEFVPQASSHLSHVIQAFTILQTMDAFLVLSAVLNVKVQMYVQNALNFMSLVEVNVSHCVEMGMLFQGLKNVTIRTKQIMMVVQTARLKMDGNATGITLRFVK